jgi:N4-(beta-N-acetylglucosaminyl)-L-asparaginase
MRTLGGFLVVELMRQGRSPQAACEEAIGRIARGLGQDAGEVQVGYLATDTRGRVGAFSVQPGFQFAVRNGDRDAVLDSRSWFG